MNRAGEWTVRGTEHVQHAIRDDCGDWDHEKFSACSEGRSWTQLATSRHYDRSMATTVWHGKGEPLLFRTTDPDDDHTYYTRTFAAAMEVHAELAGGIIEQIDLLEQHHRSMQEGVL